MVGSCRKLGKIPASHERRRGVAKDMLSIKIVVMVLPKLSLSRCGTSEVIKYTCLITARCMWKGYETNSPALNRPCPYLSPVCPWEKFM